MPLDGVGAKKDYDIWYIERRGDKWSKPINAVKRLIQTRTNIISPSQRMEPCIFHLTLTQLMKIEKITIFIHQRNYRKISTTGLN
jgi:hypothetical protein